MYIRTITISGFKSYKDQTYIEPFSPKTNCIVGSNGSGKSNLFFALRFVLGEHSGLSAEERSKLLHEGTGLAVMSAFVEVVFDNSDSRLPIDKDEVTIRRSIGLKKDEFFLDRKHVTKSDITNLLESAGFTQSNPYYIVQQGKVNELTTMRDEQRLQLLKEVAGTRIYEQRRSESLKIMHDTDGRLEKVNELITYIEDRLSELKEEMEELKEYETLDKERRVLQYTIHDRELQEAREKLEKVDQQRADQSESANSLHSRAQQISEESDHVQHQLDTLRSELNALRKEKKMAEAERQEQIRKRAQLELDVRDASERAESEQQRKEALKKESKELHKTIQKTEKEFEQAKSVYELKYQEEVALRGAIAAKQRELSSLYGKQGRSQQFKSVKERDAWIRSELEQYQALIHEKEQQIARGKKESKAVDQQLRALSLREADHKKELNTKRTELDRVVVEHGKLKAERDKCTNLRKDHWRKEQDMSSRVGQRREELQSLDRLLESTTAKTVSSGLKAVRRIMNQHKIQGIHGPMIELFDCDEKFRTAVEVTAGSSLFHVVVDTDEVASQVLFHLNRERAGRVTFMPLNRLKPRQHECPESEDALPMLQQLHFKPLYEKVFRQIFGRTLICRNLDVAQTQSRLHDLDCITLEGDQMNRRGAMTGGYYDKRKSRLECQAKIVALRAEVKRLTKEYDAVKEELKVADQQVTHIVSEMQKCETERVQLGEAVDHLQMSFRGTVKQLKSLELAKESKVKAAQHLKEEIQQMKASCDALQEELGTETLGNLSHGEQERLLVLNQEMGDLKKKLPQLSTARAEAQTQKTGLETVLDENLRKRAVEVEDALASLSTSQWGGNRQTLDTQVKLVMDALNKTEDRQQICEQAIEEKATSRRVLETRLEELRSESNQLQQDILNESKRMERVINRRTLLAQKKKSAMSKIRELGSLPADAFEKHRTTSVKVLMKSLHKVHEALKKFSHVNKKAMDQYVSFTEQREELVGRKKELDTGATSIRELIDVLDRRKDEAIHRTFRDVAKHFQAVFAELVPDGKGSLVMLRKEGGEEQGDAGSVLEYSGVAIRVQFGGAVEAQLMQQLSGGQKAVVALGLIFAIQRIDPAPFYLFDEIDSALDSEHRAAVAKCIRNQANIPDGGAQFIMTTFRPELVDIADKVYAITFRNRVSSVSTLEKRAAIEFVNADISHRV